MLDIAKENLVALWLKNHQRVNCLEGGELALSSVIALSIVELRPA
jgi:hypothetical protein